MKSVPLQKFSMRPFHHWYISSGNWIGFFLLPLVVQLLCKKLPRNSGESVRSCYGCLVSIGCVQSDRYSVQCASRVLGADLSERYTDGYPAASGREQEEGLVDLPQYDFVPQAVGEDVQNCSESCCPSCFCTLWRPWVRQGRPEARCFCINLQKSPSPEKLQHRLLPGGRMHLQKQLYFRDLPPCSNCSAVVPTHNTTSGHGMHRCPCWNTSPPPCPSSSHLHTLCYQVLESRGRSTVAEEGNGWSNDPPDRKITPEVSPLRSCRHHRLWVW